MPASNRDATSEDTTSEDCPRVMAARRRAALATASATILFSGISKLATNNPGPWGDETINRLQQVFASRRSRYRARIDGDVSALADEARQAAESAAANVELDKNEALKKFASSPGHAALLLREVASLDIAETQYRLAEVKILDHRLAEEMWTAIEADVSKIEIPAHLMSTEYVDKNPV